MQTGKEEIERIKIKKDKHKQHLDSYQHSSITICYFATRHQKWWFCILMDLYSKIRRLKIMESKYNTQKKMITMQNVPYSNGIKFLAPKLSCNSAKSTKKAYYLALSSHAWFINWKGMTGDQNSISRDLGKG